MFQENDIELNKTKLTKSNDVTIKGKLNGKDERRDKCNEKKN